MKKLTVCILAILAIAVTAPASSGDVAVIAHPSVPVRQISRGELLDLYSGDVKEWGNGAPIVVLDLKPKSGIKDAFYGYLGKSSSRMKSIWMKNLLSGEGQPPEAQASETEILEKVASTPGAIGYIDRSLVTDAVVELVIIPVESK
jgi:ABC-type phosphate transport system substrate-binding protein